MQGKDLSQYWRHGLLYFNKLHFWLPVWNFQANCFPADTDSNSLGSLLSIYSAY